MFLQGFLTAGSGFLGWRNWPEKHPVASLAPVPTRPCLHGSGNEQVGQCLGARGASSWCGSEVGTPRGAGCSDLAGLFLLEEAQGISPHPVSDLSLC